jgi:hypothetical protein
MIGLGVLATGSGAAALTGATLSNTVSPTADFRVNVDTSELVVRRGSNFGDSDTTVSTGLADIPDTSIAYVSDVASSGLNGKTTFTAAANDATNGSLNFGVLIPFDAIPTSDGSTSVSETKEYVFPDLLEVENAADTGKDIIIQYAESISGGAAQEPNGYLTDPGNEAVDGTDTFSAALVSENGDSGGSSAQVSFDEVANMFQFKVVNDFNDSLQIVSPFGASSTPGNENQLPRNGFHIPATSTESVSLSLNINTDIGDKINRFVQNQSLNTDGGTIQMVDSIFVAETNDTASDIGGSSFVINSP